MSDKNKNTIHSEGLDNYVKRILLENKNKDPKLKAKEMAEKYAESKRNLEEHKKKFNY
jgi:hypothetical protein